MSFKPINERVSVEDFEDLSAKGFDLSTDQVIRDGRLVLRGTPVVSPNPDLNWEQANFTQTSQFLAVPDRTSPDSTWIYTSQLNPEDAAASPQVFPFTDRKIRRSEFVFEEQRVPFHGGSNTTRSSRRRVAVFREADGSS